MLERTRRHWKWLVPLVAVFILTVGGAVLSMIKGAEPYVMAMEALRAHEGAIALLGEPIEDGMFPQGSMQTSGPSGRAEVAIPVSGPRGSGKLYVRATKEMGEWRIEGLVLGSGSERRDLLDGDGT